MKNIRTLSRFPVLLLVASAAACAVAPTDNTHASEDDLTSLTALTRTVKFGGVVFVRDGASDFEVLAAVKHQTQSAFGALRTSKVGVNSRELNNVDPRTFTKTKVTVVDPAIANDPGTAMTRVQYTYTDSALVPSTMAARSTISLGLLGASYASHIDAVLPACTANDTEAQEFTSALWYVFDPSLAQCKTAMATEQQKIDADRRKVKTGQVPRSEVDRLYIPMTAALTSAAQNTSASYPEYDRLYAGGVQPGKLVIGMVSGLMANWAAGEHHDTIDDEGYGMWFEGLREIFKTRPGLALTKSEPAEDFTSYTIGSKTFGGLSFKDLLSWELDGTGFPAGTTPDEQHALRVAAGSKIAQHWLTFDVPVSVKIGNAAPKPFTIELNTYFGASTDSTPHKRAIKNSDVFIYNGHSYIGYGPLDPSNFSAQDFPASYQIMFINGCVSYNYYEKDFFPLKTGGSKNLELVTNGLESWVGGSGPAMGRFAGALIDGKQESYTSILRAAQFSDFGYPWGMDALRVVDGELDNKYKPQVTPIVVK